MLDKEEINTLSKYEKLFDTAINNNYVSGVSKVDFDIIHKIYMKVSKSKEILVVSCNYCVITLMQKMGGIYYKTIKNG